MKFSSSYRSTVCRIKCCVEGCTSTMNKNVNLSFHKIPNSGVNIEMINLFGKKEIVDKRTIWMKTLNLKDEKKDLRVCSNHFIASDYVFADLDAKHRVLKKCAVPKAITKLEKYKLKKNIDAERTRRQIRKDTVKPNIKLMKSKSKQKSKVEKLTDEISNILNNKIDEKLSKITGNLNTQDISQEAEPVDHNDDCELLQQVLDAQFSYIVKEESFHEKEDLIPCSSTKRFEDKNIQVTNDMSQLTLSAFIRSESDLITLCNIKSFNILNELAKIMDETFPPKRNHVLSARDSIILTTAKLNLDISFSALAVFFNYVTEVNVRNTFYETIRKLSAILQCLIFRDLKEETHRTCFKKCQTTVAVLDCIEIRIQTPKCLKCRVNFYSHYKSDQTVKFTTEVTPTGLIIFVNECFEGRVSDKTIFNHSLILQHLESTRNVLMFDRGFLVKDNCNERQIKLIRPFMNNKHQSTLEESIQNKNITNARVHVESMKQGIKQFQILNHDFPWHMISYIDDIFIICYGLTNLDTPKCIKI